jgi:Holliday junction DNA helicase RuvA
MIAYLNGKLILKRDKFIVLEVNNIGYKVFLSQQTLFKLPQIGENLKVYCYQNVGETVLDLYGFLDDKELEFFEILNDIRGIGPKAALEISAAGPLEKIKDKILSQDENVFAGIPGVGQKRAQTIILELTGKIKTLDGKKTSADEAENALMGLGFTKQQAKDALTGVSGKTTEERVQIALKSLAK